MLGEFFNITLINMNFFNRNTLASFILVDPDQKNQEDLCSPNVT